MGGKIAFAVVALVILYIVFIRIRLELIFKNGTSSIKVRVSLFSFTLLEDESKRKKPPKKRKYTKKAIEKRQKRSKKTFVQKQGEKHPTSKNAGRKFSFPHETEALISLASSFFSDFLFPIVKRARVRFKYFRVTVATGDPSDTAILYGVVSQGVYSLLSLISSGARISDRQLKKVVVNCSFLEDRSSFEMHTTISFGVWELIILAAKGGFKLFDKWTAANNKKAENNKINK